MIEQCLVGCKYFKCVTKVDQEMANILTFNTNLIFSETKVELDMSGEMTPANMTAKIQDDLLSTGSISTFHMMMTRASQATQKSTSHAKTNRDNDASTTDT